MYYNPQLENETSNVSTEEIIETLKLSQRISTLLYYQNQALIAMCNGMVLAEGYACNSELIKISDFIRKLEKDKTKH